MNKKLVIFFDISSSFEESIKSNNLLKISKNKYFYPLASAMLINYALNNKKIRDGYEFKVIDSNYLENELLLDKKIIDKINLDKIKDIALSSNLFFFSYFLWNSLFCDRVSRRIKKYNPNAIIVYGGKNIPYIQDNESLFYPFYKKRKHIDFYCYGSGEKFFSSLLLDYLKFNYNDLKNHAFKNDNYKNVVFYNEKKELIKDNIDSLFLKNESKNPDYEKVKYSPIRKMHTENIINANDFDVYSLEIISGCPFSCTFCEFGTNQKKVYYKSNDHLKKIYDELYFLHRIRNDKFYIHLTDANLGIKKEDDIFFNFLISLKKEFPNTYCKNLYYSISKSFNNDKYLEHILKRKKVFTDHNDSFDFITLSLNGINEKSLKRFKRVNKIDYSLFKTILQHPEINKTIFGIEFVINELTTKKEILKLMRRMIEDNINYFSIRKLNVVSPIMFSLNLLYNTEDYHNHHNNPKYKYSKFFLKSLKNNDDSQVLSFYIKELYYDYKPICSFTIFLTFILVPLILNNLNNFNFSFKDNLLILKIFKKLKNGKNKFKSLKNLLKEIKKFNFNLIAYNNDITKEILNHFHQNKKRILNENIIF